MRKKLCKSSSDSTWETQSVSVIQQHGLHLLCYTDGSQLGLSTKSITAATSIFTDCLTEVKAWMNYNFLKLNCNKSEILVINPKSHLHSSKNFAFSTEGHKSSHPQWYASSWITCSPSDLHTSKISLKPSFFHHWNIACLPLLYPFLIKTYLPSLPADSVTATVSFMAFPPMTLKNWSMLKIQVAHSLPLHRPHHTYPTQTTLASNTVPD